MHLQFDCLYAPYNNITQEHPQQVMKELGILYQYATPQSIADQWWFWNCENVPVNLPPFLSVLDIVDPTEFVGFGLTEEIAEKIKNYQKLQTTVIL